LGSNLETGLCWSLENPDSSTIGRSWSTTSRYSPTASKVEEYRLPRVSGGRCMKKTNALESAKEEKENQSNNKVKAKGHKRK